MGSIQIGKHSLNVRQDLLNVLNLSRFKLNRRNHRYFWTNFKTNKNILIKFNLRAQTPLTPNV